jgi:hypothetical protein
MTRSAILLALAAAFAAPANAGAPAAQGQTAEKPGNSAEKVICRFVDTTGSRLSRNRECKTRAQWDYESRAAAEDIERGTQRATGEATNGPH